MKSQSPKQQGFTLIELITVIILLGVLSVTALPKFVNFSSDANAAVINNLAAGLKAAANLGNAKALIATGAGGMNNGFEFDGVYFDRGYPLGTSYNDSDGVPEILELMVYGPNDLTFAENFNRRASSGESTREVYITTRSKMNAGVGYTAIVAGRCYVSYESFVNDYKEPEIVKDTSGC